MRATTTWCLGLVCASALPTLGIAQGTARPVGGGGAGSGGAAGAAPGVQATFSVRSRAESWNWFDASDADGRYAYLGTIVRAGLAGTARPRVRWVLEGAAPILLGLPDDAIAGAPRGALGLGASYHAANARERNVATVFLKQAYLRLGDLPARGGHAVRLGRFEFSEGAELASPNATVATVKASRVAQRLVGPFAWTHVGRAFDGAHYTFDRPAAAPGRVARNVTLTAALPTEGAFRASAWEPLRTPFAYAAWTAGRAAPGGRATDGRLFALHYEDRRDPARAVKVDNRPAAARAADRARIRVTTLGGHLVHVEPTAAGPIDLLAWGALQTGDWGALTHRAHAAALEAGWQPTGLPARPWLRAAWFVGSGDRDPADGTHGTFFEVLPTPRPYARFPIHNLMNLEQRQLSLTLRPHPKATLRADVSALRLAERRDLWYQGGGAFERGSFGYAGRPSGGQRDFATLVDLSADLRLTRRVSLNGYVARAGAGDVIRSVYPGTGSATFGYLELDVRY